MDSHLIAHREGKTVYFTFSLLDRVNQLIHAVSTRLGGVSKGIYHSLNIGFHVGDEENNVIKNREIFCRTLGLNLSSVAAGEQVHGTHIAIVQAGDRGKGAYSWKESFPRTDALTTNVPGVSLLVVVADCPALLFFDPAHKAVALAHTGWRGSIKGSLQKTIQKMSQNFHTNPQDLLVAISPSIGPCCYRIGKDTLKQLVTSFPANWKNFVIFKPDGSAHLDLWKLNRYQLLKMGVKHTNIEIARICTACHTDLFYSHRKERGKTGRCGMIVSIKG